MRICTSDLGAVLAAYDEAGIERTRDDRRKSSGIITHDVDAEGRDGSGVQVVTSNLRDYPLDAQGSGG